MAKGDLSPLFKSDAILTARQLIRHRNIVLGLPIRRLATAYAPFGYEDDPDKEGWLRPIDKELQALYLARTMYNKYTMKQLADWITKETGRRVTRQALKCLFRTRPPLSTCYLTLDERLQIATCPTEEKAIELSCTNIRWDSRKNIPARTEYLKARTEAVKRKEEIRRAEASKQS